LVCETKAKARRKTKQINKNKKGNEFFFKDGKKTKKFLCYIFLFFELQKKNFFFVV
jgi:hypothetical protein